MSRYANRIFLLHITKFVSSVATASDCPVFRSSLVRFLEFGNGFLALWWEGSASFSETSLLPLDKKRGGGGGGEQPETKSKSTFLALSFPTCNTAVNTNIDAKYVQRVKRILKLFRRSNVTCITYQHELQKQIRLMT